MLRCLLGNTHTPSLGKAGGEEGCCRTQVGEVGPKFGKESEVGRGERVERDIVSCFWRTWLNCSKCCTNRRAAPLLCTSLLLFPLSESGVNLRQCHPCDFCCSRRLLLLRSLLMSLLLCFSAMSMIGSASLCHSPSSSSLSPLPLLFIPHLGTATSLLALFCPASACLATA